MTDFFYYIIPISRKVLYDHLYYTISDPILVVFLVIFKVLYDLQQSIESKKKFGQTFGYVQVGNDAAKVGNFKENWSHFR